MADPKWGWDPKSRRYRNTASGRYLSAKTVTGIRDRVIASASQEARVLAQSAASGAITPAAFETAMRDLLRNVHGSEAIFGRGGVNAMAPADWGWLGSVLKNQYGYLDGFVADLGMPGLVSEAQAMARAELYVGAAVKSYEQGKAASFGIAGSLPLYPGDNCEGFGNCRCSWDIAEDETEVRATWTLGGGDPCAPCAGNAAAYNPYVIPKTQAAVESAPVRLAIVRQAA